MNKCEQCGSANVKVILTNEASSMHLCMNCSNEQMSEELEVDLEQMIETFSFKDYQGISRTFYVERRLHPMGIFMEATENIEFGYKFAVHGELDVDQFGLLSQLIEKVRKGISVQHVER